VGKEWTRKCKACHNWFTSKSNGRLKCFACTPPRLSGKNIRIVGFPRRAPDVLEKTARDACKNMTTEDEKVIELMVARVEDLEHQSRLRPKRFKIGENTARDRVVAASRPDGGWGRCMSLNVYTFQADCKRERFFEGVPFCYDHIRIWRQMHATRIARRVATAVRQRKVTLKDYQVLTVREASEAFATLAMRVEKGEVNAEKAGAIMKVLGQQVEMIREQREEDKANAQVRLLEARAQKVMAGKKTVAEKLPEEEEEDDGELKDLAARHGIGVESEPSGQEDNE
jgi:hypothetical protein